MSFFPKEVLICGQIFGCFPLVYSKSAKGQTSLVFSWKIHAWSLFAVSVITVMSYYAVYSDYVGFTMGKPMRMKSVTNALATVLDVLPLNSLMLTVFFSNYMKSHIFIKIHDLLTQVDQTILLKKKSKRAKVAVILCYAIFTVAFAAVSMIHDNSDFVLYIPFWLTYFIQVASFLNFTCVMEIIENSFKTLNKKIKVTIMSQHFNVHLLLNDLGLAKVEHTGNQYFIIFLPFTNSFINGFT